jgi:hypothetical protein
MNIKSYKNYKTVGLLGKYTVFFLKKNQQFNVNQLFSQLFHIMIIKLVTNYDLSLVRITETFNAINYS